MIRMKLNNEVLTNNNEVDKGEVNINKIESQIVIDLVTSEL